MSKAHPRIQTPQISAYYTVITTESSGATGWVNPSCVKIFTIYAYKYLWVATGTYKVLAFTRLPYIVEGMKIESRKRTRKTSLANPKSLHPKLETLIIKSDLGKVYARQYKEVISD